jgi:hypothetical protein
MAKPESLDPDRTECVTCGANFGTPDAMQQHARDSHLKAPVSNPAVKSGRDSAGPAGNREENPSGIGSDQDRQKADRSRGEDDGMIGHPGPSQPEKGGTSEGRTRQEGGDDPRTNRPAKDTFERQEPRSSRPVKPDRDSKRFERESRRSSERDAPGNSMIAPVPSEEAAHSDEMRTSRGRGDPAKGRGSPRRKGQANQMTGKDPHQPSQPAGSDRDSNKGKRDAKKPFNGQSRGQSPKGSIRSKR